MSRGRLKAGANTGINDKDNNPICVGDTVVHTLTGVQGKVSCYGLVRQEGTEAPYKLTDGTWKIVGCNEKLPEPAEDTDRTASDEAAAAGKMSAENLDGFSDRQLAEELRRRGYTVSAVKTITVKL